MKLKENAELLFFGNELTSPQFSISEEYKDEIWFVIDTDRWNEGDKINQLKLFCTSKNISAQQWIVAQSNPSFELWLYYHFYKVQPEKTNVEKHASFKQFVDAAIKGGFDSRSMPIEIVNAIPVSQLPAPVPAYIKQHYKGAKITEAGKVTDAAGKISYEAEVKGKDIIFDEKGSFVKAEK